jgi:hypothetical protein
VHQTPAAAHLALTVAPSAALAPGALPQALISQFTARVALGQALAGDALARYAAADGEGGGAAGASVALALAGTPSLPPPALQLLASAAADALGSEARCKRGHSKSGDRDASEARRQLHHAS